MSEASYDVIFSGKLVEGAAEDQVKANVAKLFKVEVAKIERLFTGSPVILKKGVDEQSAKKYLLAMRQAGAICEVKGLQQEAPAPAKAEPPAQPAPAAEPAAPKPPNPFLSEDNAAPATPRPANPFLAESETPSGKSEAEIAAGEGGVTKFVIKESPKDLGELVSASIDAPGTVLVEHQDIPPPQVDTSGLSMDAPGATLVEHEDVPEPQVDISGLSMDEPGTTLVEHEDVADLDVDTSELSMDEPGVVIIEHVEEEEPEIDTSKLSLS